MVNKLEKCFSSLGFGCLELGFNWIEMVAIGLGHELTIFNECNDVSVIWIA